MRNALPGSDVRGWWWLPITNENLLINHMNKESETCVLVPRNPIPRLYVFPGAGGGVMLPRLQPDLTGNGGGGPIVDAPLVLLRGWH